MHKLHRRGHALAGMLCSRESADVCSYMRAPSVIGLHREQRGGPVLSVVAVSSPVLEN